MSKQLIARGQTTILVQKDSYTVSQSISQYLFTADNNGTISGAVSFTSIVKVTLGEDNVTNFSIGTITKPVGFSAITVNNTHKTITYSVAANTAGMADSGIVVIPILIGGQTFNVSFSYAKAKAGIDSNMLDWVKDWNTGKTVIGAESLITPKIFAGVKNANHTITGIALGKFALSTVNAAGVVATETVNGIYGFKEGNKTFVLDTEGNVQLGRGNQFVKYNAATGKIEFGSEVTLNWVNAINTAKTEAINSAATDATTKISVLEVGGDNSLPNGDFSYYSTNEAIGWDNALNGTYVMSDWGSGYNGGVPAPSTGYHAHLNLAKFGFPVLELANKNSIVNQGKRWLGINVPIYQKEKLVPGATYTFSADLMADTLKAYIHGGVHSVRKGQTSPNFNSGQYILTPSAINKWERVSYTFSLDANADLTKPLTFYIYNRSGPEGICWVKNASLQRGTKGSWVRCAADVARDVADAKQAGTNAKNVADAITNKANTEGWSTKLTYIGSTGIFTGTLSANTVNALRINASQITAGVIDAARINVDALKSSLITAGNIEALTLNVTKGKIGGWNIDADSIFRGTKTNTTGGYTASSGAVTIGSTGIRGFKWRLDSTGAGALAGGNISWDAAGTVTFAASVSLNWTNPIAAITTALGGGSFPKLTYISSTGIYTGTLTATQVNAVVINASSIKTGTLSADRIVAGSLHANKLIARTIAADRLVAGTITANEINVASIQASVVTATAVNGLTCTFAKGTIAGWNITASQIYKNSVYLRSDGSITNSTKWKLNNDGSGQLANGNISWNAAGGVTFSSSVSLAWTNDATAKADAAKELASAMAFGRMLNRDPTFSRGDNGTNVYNSSRNGMVTIIRQPDNTAPNDSKYVLLIRNKGVASPYCGGFYFATETSYRKVFITRIIAKIPIGRNISFHTNSMGVGGTQKWLTPTIGTGDWCEYVCKVKCGTSNFSSTHYFALTGAVGSESTPIEWMLSYATVFDITSTEKYTTTIDANGIYTSTLNANQIKAGTISADRIAAGSINASKLDANSIKATIINTSYINGLSCTFTKGTIGGWAIAAGSISNGQLTLDNKNRRIAVYGNGSSSISGQRVQLYFNSNSDFGFLATDASGLNVVTLGGRNSIAGWSITSSQIYKNNIYLGSDGSIYNGTKWRLNNDGSGRLASGKIVWDAAGRVTFDPSVSILWSNAANKGKLFARGTGLNHNANRLVNLNGTQIVSSSARGLMLTVIKRSNLNVISSVNYDVYGSDAVCNSLATALNALGSDRIVVLTSNDGISINSTLNTAIQRCGGSDLTIHSSRNPYVLIGIPTIGKDNGLVAVYGTETTEPFAEISTVICNGTPLGINVYGRQKTYIDGNGIYTGTLSVGQIRVDTTLVVGGSSYNGSVSVRDASNNVKVTLNRSGIIAIAGKIGGWNIDSGSLYASSPDSGHRVYIRNNGYMSNDDGVTNYWALKTDGSALFGKGNISFASDGSGYLANRNIAWDVVGNVSMRGTINATAGSIGGFTIASGRIGSTATGNGSGGGLAIYNDLFRVGSSNSYVLFGDNTFPATSGGTASTGRIVNNKYNSWANNYGLYIDVTNGEKNYGIWSNAPVVAPAHIHTKIKNIYFTGNGYTIDFSQNDLFFVYGSQDFNVNLPDASSVAQMFGYSSLPSNFACQFKLIYNYDWGYELVFTGIKDQNGNHTNVPMRKGDVLELLCANYPSFHYQLLYRSS